MLEKNYVFQNILFLFLSYLNSGTKDVMNNWLIYLLSVSKASLRNSVYLVNMSMCV